MSILLSKTYWILVVLMSQFCFYLVFSVIFLFQQQNLVASEKLRTNHRFIESQDKNIFCETLLIKKIIIKGNSEFLTEELNLITRKFLKQPATLSNLQQIAREVSQFYWNKGFLTSEAYPPVEQDISQGVVTIKVIEGELDKIDITDGFGRKIENSLIKNWLHRQAGKPLNVDDLLEGLQLLKIKYNLTKIESELQKGTLPKFSNLKLKIEQGEQYRIHLQGNNYGSFNSGQEAGNFQFIANNLSGKSDKLDVSGIVSEGSEQALIDYQIPLCLIDCLSFQFHYEIGNSEVIRQPLETFDIEGEYQKFFLEITQPIIKSSRTDLGVDLELGWQRSETFVLGRRFSFSPQTLDGQYDIYTLRIGTTWEEKWPTGALINRGEITVGGDSLSETSDPFVLFRLQSNWLEKLNENLLFSLFGSLQLTPSSLGKSFGVLPSEQFPIGGFSTVPGYDLNLRRGDNGINIKADLRQTVLKSSSLGAITINPYAAFGYVWNKRNEAILLEPTTLGSVGLNLHWKIKGIDINLGIAEPLNDVSENFEQTTYFSIGSSISF
ncbi:hypothetical protein cce_4932 [Crocosphaera subtropica ATCC 51142]|uniref:POTRA domain-containing protein n=1 Tax=Crocosphaera subtropica (strain ATCC 51142 / BH68) TaxID=43989 RepID=B1X2B7_CROS5|nr:POTRA domain-containing protein [Crocosphaera subtropica]ACB54278.1 hypothetical protein cce_4932 [Crocosphaera subtropica ATCC 51142]